MQATQSWLRLLFFQLWLAQKLQKKQQLELQWQLYLMRLTKTLVETQIDKIELLSFFIIKLSLVEYEI